MQIIKEQKNDVLVQVKANQEKLLDNCKSTSSLTKPKSSFCGEEEKSHGRIEKRDGKIYENLHYIEDNEWKELIACVGVMERSREIFDNKTKQWEKQEEVAYYICTKKITAEELVTLTRKHWGIENRNHYVRDVSLLEDRNFSIISLLPALQKRLARFTVLAKFLVSRVIFVLCSLGMIC